MKRRDFLVIAIGSTLIPWFGCSESKKLLGKASELKKQENFFEFNGNKIYVHFKENEFLILNLTCTHKKCTVERKGNLWICPCHKGKYDIKGKLLEGKPTHDLYLYDYEILQDELWVLNRYKNP